MEKHAIIFLLIIVFSLTTQAASVSETLAAGWYLKAEFMKDIYEYPEPVRILFDGWPYGVIVTYVVYLDDRLIDIGQFNLSAQTVKIINIPNLPPGKYILRLTAKLPDIGVQVNDTALYVVPESTTTVTQTVTTTVTETWTETITETLINTTTVTTTQTMTTTFYNTTTVYNTTTITTTVTRTVNHTRTATETLTKLLTITSTTPVLVTQTVLSTIPSPLPVTTTTTAYVTTTMTRTKTITTVSGENAGYFAAGLIIGIAMLFGVRVFLSIKARAKVKAKMEAMRRPR